MLKNTLKHPENTNKTCFEAFWEILENPVLGSKMWFSAQISNYAKIPWNTQKIPTKHVLRLFKKFLKIRFSAQKSGSRPRCRQMLKILWNTQKTPTKHALRHFKKFLKIRFLAEKSGSRLICRIMLKYHETLRKHQLNMFWGFLRNSRKSGSRLKNPVLGSKMWFSAQISNYAKIPWNTQKTPTGHVLRHFKKFLKIRFLAEKSGSRLICRIMLKYHETLRKHQLNMFWGFLRNSRKSGSRLKNPVLGSKMWFSAQISNYAKIPWNTQNTPTEHVLRLLKNFLKIRFSAQTSGSRLRCRTMLKIHWNSGNTN